jgi:signal transduction histidine kinase
VRAFVAFRRLIGSLKKATKNTPLHDSFVPNHTKRSPDQSGAQDTRLSGHTLILARVVWVAVVTLIVALFLVILPAYNTQLQTVCTGATCAILQPTPDTAQAIQKLGLSVGAYATFTLALTITLAILCFAISAVIFWRKSDDWMALLVALGVVALGTLYVTFALQASHSAWQVPAIVLNVLGNGVFFLVCLLFPNGRFVPRWTRWLPLIWVVSGMVFLIFRDVSSVYLVQLVWLGVVILLVITLLYRYHYASSPLQRQQTKWVIFGICVAGIIVVALTVPILFFPSLRQAGSYYHFLIGPAYIVVVLIVPICIGLAILRYRLYDIDIIIHRTLLYGLLTACVVALYVLVVGGLGALLQTKGNLLISLLATALIAVLIQPLHTGLQRAVNRLLYGERDEPYKVISRLGQRLEATLAPEAVLPTIVETVTGALKLPYAAISLKQDGEDVIAASSGRAVDELTRLPLVYQSEPIGDLLLAPRARGESFSSADWTLLNDLARQAGIAVHAVRLTTDLQHLTKELQHSRTRLVTAREEERRRLRRDLHDGLGSVLASLNWRAGALRLVLSRDPVAADALMVEQQNTIQAAIGDIRRLVYDLRPPALDELGLLGAIRERAAKQRVPAERDSVLGLHVEVVAPDHLPALPAAVEVAAYRIVQEALTNVVRHAQAHWCWICLSCEQDMLHLEVSDDGIGLPESCPAGVGVLSMRERAAELGGTCEIERTPEGGTCVRACLPRRMHDQER